MTTEGETQSMDLDSASLSDIILDQERRQTYRSRTLDPSVIDAGCCACHINNGFETLREGAKFMGVMGQRGDLKSPFGHIDASIWKEGIYQRG